MRADIFTEEAMTRPLFEDLTGDHAREDEWCGPHGFAIGGMMQANTASLAEEYFTAANELVDAIKEKRIADYRIGNAALFLYRHSCELILKAALPASKRTHDLTGLTDSFVEMIKEKYGQDVPAWVVRRMKELAAIDPNRRRSDMATTVRRLTPGTRPSNSKPMSASPICKLRCWRLTPRWFRRSQRSGLAVTGND